MANYKIVTVHDLFAIEEVQTGFTIKTFNDQKQAKKYMKWLNGGGYFAGNTPQFFARHLSLTINI